jgi:hypothetical protein
MHAPRASGGWPWVLLNNEELLSMKTPTQLQFPEDVNETCHIDQ